MNGYEQQARNDYNGLLWIKKFLWLRSYELGILLWPGDRSWSRTRADRVIRSWSKRGLVILRELPERQGHAVFLSHKGAEFLTNAGVDAKSGKDVGTIIDKTWQPPNDWKHHLLNSAVLAWLHQLGNRILPEHEIKSTTSGLKKIPDGLVHNGSYCYLLETEQSRKSGPHLRHLVQTIIEFARHRRESIAGLRVTHVLIAYVEKTHDERGHQLDHRKRIEAAIEKMLKGRISITWMKCDMRKTFPVQFSGEICVYMCPKTRRILHILDEHKWQACENDWGQPAQCSHYGKTDVMLYQSRGNTWHIQISSRQNYYEANSFEEAKEVAAAWLAHVT